MNRTIRTACFVLLLGALAARAQDYGDTPYVQTPQNVVDRMLEVAQVKASDYVIDLGSGDGRMIITAAKRYGARGFGVDLDKRLVALSNRRAAQAGVADRAKFYAQDLYETDLSPASVVTIYLLPEVNLMVRPRLLSMLRPGARIVSHDYDMGDWPPDLAFTMDAPGKTVGRDERSKVFYWVVPAPVAGRWQWRQEDGGSRRDFEIELTQNYQKLHGRLKTAGNGPAPLEDIALVGDRIRFSVSGVSGGVPVRHAYSGRIVNNAMEGEVQITRGAEVAKAPWSAARVEVWQPQHATAPAPVLPR